MARSDFLTPQQSKFIAAYLKHSNGAQAAEDAGWAGNRQVLANKASELLRMPLVRAALDAAMRRGEMTSEETLREIARIGTSDVSRAYDEQGNLLPIHEIPEDVRRAISEITTEEIMVATPDGKRPIARTVKVKFWNKGQSLEQMGKRLKLWTDRLELGGELKVNVEEAHARLAERFKQLEVKPPGDSGI